MLRLENVSRSFVQRGVVLEGLSLNAAEGESISVMGPSGSGKTTLLNIIGLLDRPDSGEVFFKDKSLNSLSPDESALYRNRNIGFIFQEHLLLPHLTVMENIMLPLFARRLSAEEYKAGYDNAVTLVEKAGITGLSGKYPFQISGGEAQRVTLVRSLVNKPDMLLADEPTGSLDSRNAEILGKLFNEINRDLGIMLLVVTHSQSLAERMSTHYKLENGRLIRY